MSYDIDLINKNTKKILQMKNPAYVRGGTMPAEFNINGDLVQALQTEASVNITYNYASYYYEAAEGDPRFLIFQDGKMENGGIRGVYGKTARESYAMLQDLYMRIHDKYYDKETGQWLISKRTRYVCLDQNGNAYKDPIYPILNHLPYSKMEETYTVSEGYTENYWEKTAANALNPLVHMMHMATDYIFDDEAVWSGD